MLRTARLLALRSRALSVGFGPSDCSGGRHSATRRLDPYRDRTFTGEPSRALSRHTLPVYSTRLPPYPFENRESSIANPSGPLARPLPGTPGKDRGLSGFPAEGSKRPELQQSGSGQLGGDQDVARVCLPLELD